MNSRILLCVTLTFLFAGSVSAQFVPGGFSYQAIAREIGGDEIVGQNLTVRIAIIAGQPDGTIVYEEVHDVVTNEFGLFAIEVGSGVQTGAGTYAFIDEIPFGGGPHFFRVDVDTPESVGFEYLGTTELLAVPYAFHAGTADSAPEADGDVTNELITGFDLSGSVLTITEAGTDYAVDLAALGGSGSNMDPSTSNELITGLYTENGQLIIDEGNQSISVPLADITGNAWQLGQGAVFATGSHVGIGTDIPSSQLHVNGSLALAVVTVSGDELYDPFVADDTHSVLICDVTNGTVEIMLPDATSCPGRMYQFRKFFSGSNSLNPLVLVASPSDLIDGSDSVVFDYPMAEYVSVVSNGSDWFVINHSREN